MRISERRCTCVTGRLDTAGVNRGDLVPARLPSLFYRGLWVTDSSLLFEGAALLFCSSFSSSFPSLILFTSHPIQTLRPRGLKVELPKHKCAGGACSLPGVMCPFALIALSSASRWGVVVFLLYLLHRAL